MGNGSSKSFGLALVVTLALLSQSASASAPAGWPDGFRGFVRLSSWSVTTPDRELALTWDDDEEGYVAEFETYFIKVHGSTLAEMYLDVDGTGDNGDPVDLSGRIGGKQITGIKTGLFSASFRFVDALGLGHLNLAMASSLLFSGIAFGVGVGLLIIPFAEFFWSMRHLANGLARF